MQIRIFVLLLLMGSGTWTLLAQPCTEYPNPIIQTDFEAYCQGSPQDPVIPSGPAPEASVPVFALGDCSIVCENSPVAYTVPNADPTHQFYWEAFGTAPGSPATGTGASFSAQWGGVGIGLIRVTETTPDNCATSVEQCIEIIASPEADFTTLPPALSTGLTVCNGTTVPFFDQSQGDVITWSWDFGDGTASNEENPSHTYAMEGTYTVVLMVTNECGTTTTMQVIVIQEGGSAPTAGFSADPLRGCAPLEVSFSDLSSGGVTSWAWTFVGGLPATSTEQNPVVTYSQPGIYEVALTVTNAQGSNTLTLSSYIEVLAQPTAGFTFLNDNSGAINFTNTSSDATSYSWDFGDGNSSTEENPTHTYASSGIYEVVLTVSNECGENTFTDTIDLRITSTSEPSFIQALDLYPNPNDGQFMLYLRGEPRPTLELTLFNVLGQVVDAESRRFNGQLRREFDLRDQPSGVYLLQIRSERELRYHKIVVE